MPTCARAAEESGREVASTLRASSVSENIFNSPVLARLNGLAPDSPFVTQRPQSGYVFYKVGR